MRYVLNLLLVCVFTQMTFAQNGDVNMALHLDGKDNNVRTGIGIIKAPWTIEAWVKGNDMIWKNEEVIFGGGEYSQLNIADYLPLEVKKGRLLNTKTGLSTKTVLDNKWHHVALSCDGAVTRLYLDGNMVGRRAVAFSILPGALGVDEEDSTTFGGLMDEVRIWHSAVPGRDIREWMHKPLSPTHPQFHTLIGYYNFDDGMEDVSVNWVGKGDQAYHLRNGRNNFRGTASLAYTVVNDNPKFVKPSKRQGLFNAVVINSEWDADQGTRDDQVLKLRVAVTGAAKPLSLTRLAFDLSKVSALSDISRIHVYYTGKTARSNTRIELFGGGRVPAKKMIFTNPIKKIYLTPGIHYFLLTADIAGNAIAGDKIKITIPSFKLDNCSYIPETGKQQIDKQITYSSKTNPNIVKVLQWNIWHGGIHLGNDGLGRIIDLVKATHADVITMQEAYGSQQRITDSLGYGMHTASPKDNLAIYSRYPMTVIPTSYKAFNSNPIKITLPNGQPLLIDACWIRYASSPEYTSCYPGTGLDPRLWIREDSLLGLADIQHIVDKDVKPYTDGEDIPVIIGGDFNSCSHLDWTKAAASLHAGYGPVAFPISRYLLSEGYKDSFREMNPDEVKRPEGTWAAIYGQLQACRIDFLYYKGRYIKAVASKIVKTAPEIDDVWASDHAAVLSTFELAHFLN
ncbi:MULTISPECIES: LamG-like jellyroll fold domain-containing protein [Chitinophagaceae]